MRLTRWLPFLSWFPMPREAFTADMLAGVSVALLLVPQSMAWAQVAGLPPQYGLYASFLPVIVGALWGSSRHLATGPVGVTSLLTASLLTPLAPPGSEAFVALAILLALLAGGVRVFLGAFRLGVIVNFLSHPVMVGFTNAAALIIALSQLHRVLGVPTGRSERFVQDLWAVLAQVGETHLPTLLMGLATLAIIWATRRYLPRLPAVLIAVVVTALVSWAIGFEHNGTGRVDDIADEAVRSLARDYGRTARTIGDLQGQIRERSAQLRDAVRTQPEGSARAAAIRYQVELLSLELRGATQENRARLRDLRRFVFARSEGSGAAPPRLFLAGTLPAGVPSDGFRWRIGSIDQDGLTLVGGGEVVGFIPSGLPRFQLPRISGELLLTLIAPAFIIALVGFTEAISSAKAIATRTKQRIDPNQELIGQGLANLAGSLFQSFPVSGSFSRTALNYAAGARTGFSSVVSGLVVLPTLLFFTPLLYHLPQSMLAATIMISVVGLIDFPAMRHAWRVSRTDGAAALIAFVATLGFAPQLDTGILIGVGTALVLFLVRTMKPRVAVLGRHPDGTLRDADLHGLPLSEDVAAVRFDGQLYFGNVSYFEDAILEVAARFPRARYILVAGAGINRIDASGEQIVRQLTHRLRESGITLAFSGLKHQVLRVLRRTGLLAEIGDENIFPSDDAALAALRGRGEGNRRRPHSPSVERGASTTAPERG
jgi:SulP family sulfate permease